MLVLLPPALSVLVPKATVLPVLPANEPIDSSPVRLSVLPDASVTADKSPIALPPVATKVPSCTLVAPV